MDTTRSDTADRQADAVTLKVDDFKVACARKKAYKIGQQARLVGVDRTTLDNWFRGPVAVRLDVAFRVATALDCSVHDLWTPTTASES